ncbi:NADPH:quinone oxidoreductase family protein [Sneathiella sp. HT1-7]|uniref:NADPH:quinone oxidoreductase family protein n=1 Tax=Sneathiella sp. HT1-7 TaxID=2887192 RepID=UPI001D13D05C|nr:NADPH:quinone oxidoreductase family protein [Sneathiella sp. HT1-7]MCC3304556.1 NADPH:quinone oxidoreductase family protein [Sneathiella sp. HT1-7]
MTNKFATATICHDLSGPDGVRLEPQQLEPLAPGQLRIRLKAAALNFPDLLMTYGKYQFKPELPFTLGMEAVGVVEETTDPDGQYQIGDAVLYKSKTGAFAAYATVEASQIEPMPKHLSYAEAAAFSVTFLTAYVSLIERGRLKAGEVLLVLGAGGGVGQATVALGKALGATVIAAASSEDKLKVAKESGADHLINYHDHSFPDRVNEITDGKGADVILDPVGGTFFEKSLDCIAWSGRLLVAGFAGGEFGVLKTDLTAAKGCSVIGVRAGEFGRRDPAAGARVNIGLRKIAEAENLRPIIGRTWALAEISDALRAMERRDVTGKQVVLIED